MTDRRFAPRSLMSSDDVTDWCNTDVTQRSTRSSDSSVGSNFSRSSRLKRFHIVMCAVTLLIMSQFLAFSANFDSDDIAHVEKKNGMEGVDSDSKTTTQESRFTPQPPLRSTAPPSSSHTDEKENPMPTLDPEPESITLGLDYQNVNYDIGSIGDESKNQSETPPPFMTMIEEEQAEIDIIYESKNATSNIQNRTDVTPTEASKSNETQAADEIKPKSPNSELSETARNYVETHCDLAQVKDGAWYPSGLEDDWKQRAPYLIIAGVWNGGVMPLRDALLKNPNIHLSNTKDFFLPKNFYRYHVPTRNKSMNSNNQTESTGDDFTVKVFAARERMYASAYSRALYQEKLDEESSLETNRTNQHIGIDVSPGLLFYAQKTAQSVLCTTPWAKVILILRNPIDRLYQQWAFSTKNLRLKTHLEDFLAAEVKVLQSVGIMAGGEEKAKDEPVLSEKEAWKKYQAVHGLNGAIGRSMYVLQMEDWIQAYVDAGKIPSEEIMILTAEDFMKDPTHEYSEIMKFLGLDGDEGVALALANTLSQDSNVEPMSQETRKMLKKFFRPYNTRLTKLLTSNGFGGDWDEQWK